MEKLRAHNRERKDSRLYHEIIQQVSDSREAFFEAIKSLLECP